ncbi:hypothetical protein RHGRI_003618 [Rhododendron griersonianum]|uniref:Uncharacterized protein n=1 Tax=Rhododendron griersonianum TaxID=479676 RepID=A0AAV6L7H3_9ERIC|nr:hypothetical protein RHGRI_003618 [Rhododendron griersonianum]
MAAPTNGGESDMATEELYSDFSSLLYPTFSPPRLTPLPPPLFLPSSSSMVIYQGSNQSMDDPTQNQEHEDIVDPALYLAGLGVVTAAAAAAATSELERGVRLEAKRRGNYDDE